jgi:hypothetical protein
MNAALTLEVGEDEKTGRCPCCGAATKTGHGFIYNNEVPYAVYYAAWSSGHPERGAALAIAIGEWEEDSSNLSRTCFGLDAIEGEDQIFFRFVDPDASPWPNTDLLGPMLKRSAALAHPLKGAVLTAAERIVATHPGLKRFLGSAG